MGKVNYLHVGNCYESVLTIICSLSLTNYQYQTNILSRCSIDSGDF